MQGRLPLIERMTSRIHFNQKSVLYPIQKTFILAQWRSISGTIPVFAQSIKPCIRYQSTSFDR
jgi:hypothetical protein